MKLSDLWPRSTSTTVMPKRDAGMTVTVTKRAGAAEKRPVNGPRELPPTLPECELLEEELCRDAIRLECQIGVAEGLAKSDGHYADPTWYHRAKAALKHIQRDRQRLMVHMKQLRIQARRNDPHWQSRDQMLIRALRQELPSGRFDQIVEEVEMNIEAGIGR
ncbi:hypothetical protein [Pseudomonas bohemica]|uniref:hypothetical protein n=1 Tax=Pseudomonas bohemica TaxID=2044872 RepID=UPI000DA6219F|nr:hypothetical protein [Pseudomonas bohemica]